MTLKNLKWKKDKTYKRRGATGFFLDRKEYFMPEHRWTSEHFSIIYPIGHGEKFYELYDGDSTYQFKTIKETKLKAENLFNNKSHV